MFRFLPLFSLDRGDSVFLDQLVAFKAASAEHSEVFGHFRPQRWGTPFSVFKFSRGS